MKKIAFIIAVLWGSTYQGNSQTISKLYPVFDVRNQIAFRYSEESNSTAFTNRFLRMYRNSEYISREIMREEAGFQGKNNYIGQYRNIDISALIKNKKDDYSYLYAGVGHQLLGSVKYNDEAIKLILLGNQSFQGDTALIPQFDYYVLYLEQIKVGKLYFREQTGFKSFFRWNLALNTGQNYQHLQIRDSYLYTAPDGDAIDIKANVTYESSDTSWTELYIPSGKGISADLNYGIEIQDRYYLEASVRNIGFLSWSRSPRIMKADTTVHFEGIHTTLADTSGISFVTPTTGDLFTTQNPGSFIRMLPLRFSAIAGIYLAQKRVFAGTQIRYFSSLKNRLQVSFYATYTSHQKTFMTVRFTGGGFGNWNAGVHIGIQVNENLRFQGGTSYMNSMFNKYGRGAGWNFGLIYYFDTHCNTCPKF